MMHLRQPILLPKKEPLRALIHARFSTEEQRQSSIDDQVASCRTFLRIARSMALSQPESGR